MARFTSIGMGRKTFVASAAEDRQATTDKTAEAPEAGPSKPKKDSKKRGRKGEEGEGGGAWGRDSEVAKKAKINAQRSAERRMKRQNLNTTSTTCFACRSIGHAARDCPNVLLAAQGATQDGTATLLGEGETAAKADAPKGLKRGKGQKGGEVTGGKCYRCDSTSHSLSHCPVKVDPSNPTPFATCFICLAKGHLSSLCPNNTKGVYVKGGCCKVCGSVKHRANDCPDDKRGKRPAYDAAEKAGAGEVVPRDVGADEDDFMVQSRQDLARQAIADKAKEKKKKAKHPPNNNGPREKYNKSNGGDLGVELTTSALLEPRQQPMDTPSVAALSAEPPASPAPAPAQAPAPAPVVPKRAKPKVVKF